uniref:Phosphotransferase n=1 Tax=Parastrongyloides trichosuri TaxID=131310 RepID=A0A0N4ZES1_PARTI
MHPLKHSVVNKHGSITIAKTKVDSVRGREKLKRINSRNSIDFSKFEEIQEICKPLILTNEDCRELMVRMEQSFEEGLRPETAKTAAIKMLPSYVRAVSNGTERGNFLALDLGGTNFRVLLITLNGKDNPMSSKIYRVPDYIMKGTGEALFDHIAKCLAEFMDENDLMNKEKLPLGFTFSFPCSQEGLTCARLCNWTKGFKASNVEGNDVVQLLREACKRRGDVDIDVVAILNDTTGTMMACAFQELTCNIGVICGTGSNACYMEKINKIYKIAGEIDPENDGQPDEMCINTEWGAFGDDGKMDFIRTKFDEIVDKGTINQGKQLFEKMISGMYMGEIVRVILEHLAREGIIFGGDYYGISQPGSFPTKYVSEIEADIANDQDRTFLKTQSILEDIGIDCPNPTDCSNVAYVCSIVSTRAAHLCAVGIATLINRINKPMVTVGIDGSVYRFHPTFPELLDQKVEELVNPGLDFQIMLSHDGSGRGAALVAAVATRINNESKSN